METYRATRDAGVMGIYDFTTQLATLEPPPPEMQQLLGAIHGDQPAMDAFIRMNAGAMTPEAFVQRATRPAALAEMPASVGRAVSPPSDEISKTLMARGLPASE
jgi:hypothetical protein